MTRTLRAYAPAILFLLVSMLTVTAVHARDAARSERCGRVPAHYQECMRGIERD